VSHDVTIVFQNIQIDGGSMTVSTVPAITSMLPALGIDKITLGVIFRDNY